MTRIIYRRCSIVPQPNGLFYFYDMAGCYIWHANTLDAAMDYLDAWLTPSH